MTEETKQAISKLLNEKIKLPYVKWFVEDNMVMIITYSNNSIYSIDFENELFELMPYRYLEDGKFQDGVYRIYHLDSSSIKSHYPYLLSSEINVYNELIKSIKQLDNRIYKLAKI